MDLVFSSDDYRFLAATEYSALQTSDTSIAYNLPDNESTQGLAAGLRAAFEAYSDSQLGHERCIVFLVQSGERNVFDQRHLEYAVKSTNPPIAVIRLPFSEILERTSVADTSGGSSSIDRQITQQRYMKSRSCTCAPATAHPTIRVRPTGRRDTRSSARPLSSAPRCYQQLAGTKKVQQVLATHHGRGSVASPLSPLPPRRLRGRKADSRNFHPHLSTRRFGSGAPAREWAHDPQICMNYVLKPQREGGGNNYYKSKIPQHLKTVPEEHWKSFILMELITPPPIANIILRNGKLERGGVICELGIYGCCLWDQDTGAVLYNEELDTCSAQRATRARRGEWLPATAAWTPATWYRVRIV